MVAKSRRAERPTFRSAPNSITGFTIVNAANLDDAEKMAEGNPYISSIRIYEVRSA